MNRPIEHEYNSFVSYCRELEKYCDWQASALAEKDAEIERLRSALSNAEDALLNSQTYITASHPIGFGKVCKDVNELALGIVRTALKENYDEQHKTLARP
jgi:hypothetical protein